MSSTERERQAKKLEAERAVRHFQLSIARTDDPDELEALATELLKTAHFLAHWPECMMEQKECEG